VSKRLVQHHEGDGGDEPQRRGVLEIFARSGFAVLIADTGATRDSTARLQPAMLRFRPTPGVYLWASWEKPKIET